MDLNQRPKKPLIKLYDKSQPLNYAWIHPERKVRFEFYKKVLVPSGHAIVNDDGYDPILSAVSEEFFEAINQKDPILQAWIKLIL